MNKELNVTMRLLSGVRKGAALRCGPALSLTPVATDSRMACGRQALRIHEELLGTNANVTKICVETCGAT